MQKYALHIFSDKNVVSLVQTPTCRQNASLVSETFIPAGFNLRSDNLYVKVSLINRVICLRPRVNGNAK